MTKFKQVTGLALSAFMATASIAAASSITSGSDAAPVINEKINDEMLMSIQEFECVEDVNGIKVARFDYSDEAREYFGWTEEDHPESFYTIEMVKYMKEKLIEDAEDQDSPWFKEKIKQYDAAIEALQDNTQECEVNHFNPSLPLGAPK